MSRWPTRDWRRGRGTSSLTPSGRTRYKLCNNYTLPGCTLAYYYNIIIIALMLLHSVWFDHLCTLSFVFFLQIIFVFKSPLNPGNEGIAQYGCFFISLYLYKLLILLYMYNHYNIVMGAHQTLHGDGVKDIAFSVEDCRALYKVTLYKIIFPN